jgi:8-oxo-dGTP diphosphatase
MPYTPKLGTLAYILSKDKSQVLLIRRDRLKEDLHYGKYNGVGGKLEPNEDVVTGIKREINEETGVEATKLTFRGTVSWPGFGKNGEDWFGFIFRVDAFTGTPMKVSPEGSLVWVPIKDILTLPMWEGDRHFLPMVFDDEKTTFHGILPYKNGKPTSWSYERL